MSEEGADLVGERVGRFEIVAKLGAGGMGVVYRAYDATLRRDVALKVLPPALTRDGDRRLRFLREARSAAAAAHPAIATIYDVGESEGLVYIAMELVDGETLRDVVRRGPVPLAEVLRVGASIASGLARAHRTGIVHRDLKPENVMLGAEGEVKVLDFGIAKLRGPELEASDEIALTGSGMILGTPGYMAPEQARGAPLDARADVFALGVLLYEMLAGTHPFRGQTAMAVLASSLGDEPTPIEQLRGDTPPALADLIARCLAKDPAERPHDAGEVRRVLDPSAPSAHPPPIGTGPELAATIAAPRTIPGTRVAQAAPTRRRSVWIEVAVVGAVVGAAALALALYPAAPEDRAAPSARPPAPVRELRLEDLRRVTASPAERPIDAPVLDPLGERLAWVEGGRLNLMDLASGARRTHPVGPRVRGLHFEGRDALLVVECGEAGACVLTRLDLESGARTPLREDLYSLAVAPDGSRIALRAADGSLRLAGAIDEAGTEVLGLRSAPHAGTFDVGGNLFVRSGRTVVRVGAAGDVSTLLESPRRVSGTHTFAPIGLHHWVVAAANWPPDPEGTSLWLLDHREEPTRAFADALRLLRLPPGLAIDYLSAGGHRVAFSLETTQTDVWVAPVEPGRGLGEARRLTLDDRGDRSIGWLDPSTVLFTSDRTGRSRIYAQRLDDAAPRALQEEDGLSYPVAAPGGGVLAWRTDAPTPGDETARVALVHVADDAAPRPVLAARMTDAYYPTGLPGPRLFGARCTVASANGAPEPRCVLASQRGSVLELRRFTLDGALAAPTQVVFDAESNALAWDLCPDGRRALIATHDVGARVLEVDLDEGTHRIAGRLDDALERLHYVACGHTGFWTTGFVARPNGRYVLVRWDGEGGREVVLRSDTDWLAHPAESPDGRHLAFVRAPHDNDVYLLELGPLPGVDLGP